MDFADARFAAEASPYLGRLRGVGQLVDAIHDHQRPAFHADVARITQHRDEVEDESAVVVLAVLLGDEHLVVEAIPGAGPILVGPADAEWKVGPALCEQAVERLFEKSPAVEPVVVEAETVDPMTAGHVGLPLEDSAVIEIVVANVGMRHMRLLVPAIHGAATADVSPLGEPVAPPKVVLRDAVELRQVHGDGPHGRRGGWISRGQGTGAGGREGAVAGGMNGIVGRVWVEQPPPLIGGHGSKEPGHPLEKKVLRPPLGSERERQLFPAESAESLNHDDDAAGQTLSGRRLC